MLLPIATFADVLATIAGQRVYYAFDNRGNCGDDMIRLAERHLLRRFDAVLVEHPQQATAVVWGGGGNMGCRYPHVADVRSSLRERFPGLQRIVFPQSWSGPEDWGTRSFARERASLVVCTSAVLAPDMALAWDPPNPPAPTAERGVWLRNDAEGLFRPSRSDPTNFAASAQAYFELAARYHHVVTDRLHFAIAALHAGRRVTLLPNAYHKNRSMWETWLADLGCLWAMTPEAALS